MSGDTLCKREQSSSEPYAKQNSDLASYLPLC